MSSGAAKSRAACWSSIIDPVPGGFLPNVRLAMTVDTVGVRDYIRRTLEKGNPNP